MTFRPEQISPETWPAVFALLRPAIERDGEWTAQDLIDALLDKRAQLWVLRTEGGDPKAAGVTERYGSLLHCHLLGGEGVEAWIDDLFETVAGYARPVGIEKFTLEGRLGWERVLGRRGWKKRAVVMEISL